MTLLERSNTSIKLIVVGSLLIASGGCSTLTKNDQSVTSDSGYSDLSDISCFDSHDSSFFYLPYTPSIDSPYIPRIDLTDIPDIPGFENTLYPTGSEISKGDNTTTVPMPEPVPESEPKIIMLFPDISNIDPFLKDTLAGK